MYYDLKNIASNLNLELYDFKPVQAIVKSQDTLLLEMYGGK